MRRRDMIVGIRKIRRAVVSCFFVFDVFHEKSLPNKKVNILPLFYIILQAAKKITMYNRIITKCKGEIEKWQIWD
jgi:hypothetical protein